MPKSPDQKEPIPLFPNAGPDYGKPVDDPADVEMDRLGLPREAKYEVEKIMLGAMSDEFLGRVSDYDLHHREDLPTKATIVKFPKNRRKKLR